MPYLSRRETAQKHELPHVFVLLEHIQVWEDASLFSKEYDTELKDKCRRSALHALATELGIAQVKNKDIQTLMNIFLARYIATAKDLISHDSL